jgi:hypothetical protein
MGLRFSGDLASASEMLPSQWSRSASTEAGLSGGLPQKYGASAQYVASSMGRRFVSGSTQSIMRSAQ